MDYRAHVEALESGVHGLGAIIVVFLSSFISFSVYKSGSDVNACYSFYVINQSIN